MRILIGYDGSDCSEETFEDLRLAGLPAAVEAVVLSVANVWLPPAPIEGVEPAVKVMPLAVERAREHAEAKLGEAQSTADRGASRLHALFPSWHVKAEAVADSPSWAVIKKASEWKADLVVVGSHGYSGFNRLTLGSVSQKIVNESPCSVRIARKRERKPGQPIHIVVGLDGSENSDLAIRTVLDRKWPTGTEVHLITAIDENVITAIFEPSPLLSRWVSENDEEPLTWVGRMIADYRQQLEAAGLHVHSLVNDGDPKTLLVAESTNWGADTLFVGAKGHNLIERFLIGSVSTSIISRAECSVEVVR